MIRGWRRIGIVPSVLVFFLLAILLWDQPSGDESVYLTRVDTCYKQQDFTKARRDACLDKARLDYERTNPPSTSTRASPAPSIAHSIACNGGVTIVPAMPNSPPSTRPAVAMTLVGLCIQNPPTVYFSFFSQAEKASAKVRSPCEPFSIARMARIPLA